MAREVKSKGRIITPKATREITILFYQKLNRGWTTFSEYPRSKLETLYACYRAQHFQHKQLDEEVKKEFVELVKRYYSDWMFHIKNPIFKNGPSFIPTLFWKKMVDKWMDGDQEVSINEIHVMNSLYLSCTLFNHYLLLFL